MAGLALLCVEGLLAQRSERLVEAQPIIEGLTLLQGLKNVYRVALSTFEESPEHVEHWLRMHGVREVNVILYRTADITTEIACRDDHVHRARVLAPLDLFVSPDPQSVAKATHVGVTSLLFAHPTYARPEHRPDVYKPLRPWSVISDELDHQAMIKRTTPMVTGDVDG